MAKYSTGGSRGGSSDGTCELCGQTTESLTTATVAGAELNVCSNCANLDESKKTGGHGRDENQPRSEADRRKRAAQNTAKQLDSAKSESNYWEEHGSNYDADQLPYLVSDYGERVTNARQDAGFTQEELAEELDLDENDLLAVEQGRATQANVGGSVIRTLEDRFDISLSEE